MIDKEKNKHCSDLWVVTVNWNQPTLTIQCVNSIKDRSEMDLEIVIVDNGSTDDSVNIFKQELPFANVITLDYNMGFAKGFNHGIKYALTCGAEYIFIVNNDTQSEPMMLDILMANTKRLGSLISAPAIYYADQTEQVWSIGSNFCKFLLMPLDAHLRKSEIPKEPVTREFLTGCALLFHKNVFEKLGYFDEMFFLYFEDLDFFFRAKQKSIHAWLIPQAKLLHYVSASSKYEHSEFLHYWLGFSNWLYFKKHAKFWQWIYVVPWRLGHAVKKTIVLILNGNIRSATAFLTGFLCMESKKYGNRIK